MRRPDLGEVSERVALRVEGDQSHLHTERGALGPLLKDSRHPFLEFGQDIADLADGNAPLGSTVIDLLQRAGTVESNDDLHPLDGCAPGGWLARLPPATTGLGIHSRRPGCEAHPRSADEESQDERAEPRRTRGRLAATQPASHRVTSLAKNQPCAAPAAHPTSAKANTVGRLGSRGHSSNALGDALGARRRASTTRNPTSRSGPARPPTRNPLRLAAGPEYCSRTSAQAVAAPLISPMPRGGRSATPVAQAPPPRGFGRSGR